MDVGDAEIAGELRADVCRSHVALWRMSENDKSRVAGTRHAWSMRMGLSTFSTS